MLVGTITDNIKEKSHSGEKKMQTDIAFFKYIRIVLPSIPYYISTGFRLRFCPYCEQKRIVIFISNSERKKKIMGSPEEILNSVVSHCGFHTKIFNGEFCYVQWQ